MSRHAKLPGNWKNVLRNDDNKDELFQFLGQERVAKNTRSSYSPYWVVSLALEMVRIQMDFKHTHTKRQTPGCLYIKDTMNSGFKSVMIRTVDTDVVVLHVAHFQGLIKR